LITGLGATALAVVGIYSLTTEFGLSCTPDLKLWLSVAVGHSTTRFLLKFLIEMNVLGYFPCSSTTYLAKILEMLDVFGLVWFSVGNLLVFNGTGCADLTPMVFYTSCFYIVSVYLYLFLPVFLRICFSVRLPQELFDREQRRNRGDALVAVFEQSLLQHLGMTGLDSGGASHNVTPEVKTYWIDFLTKQCHMREYNTLAELQQFAKAEGEGAAQGQGQGQGQGSEDVSFCPICYRR
jgi:hypothetical protein